MSLACEGENGVNVSALDRGGEWYRLCDGLSQEHHASMQQIENVTQCYDIAWLHEGIWQGLTCDGVVHGSQCLPGESTLLPERMPEVAAVPAVQEVYIGLADGDVSRRRVGVQLLMPLLQELVLDPLRAHRGAGVRHTLPVTGATHG